jgi:hypothetical protein
LAFTKTTNGSFVDGNQETINSNIKDMMNSSAPICISSFLKNGQ